MQLTPLSTHWAPRKKNKKGYSLFRTRCIASNMESHIGRNIIRYRSIVSWPEDGCIISRNMSPRTKWNCIKTRIVVYWSKYLYIIVVCRTTGWHPLKNTVWSRFTTVRFTTIQFYNTCPVGTSTPDLWCIAVATRTSFLYLGRFWLFSGVHVFPVFLF